MDGTATNSGRKDRQEAHPRAPGNTGQGVAGLVAPSKTSVWTLAARAVGARDADAAIRNPDWLAEPFLGREERDLLRHSALIRALEQDHHVALRTPEVRSAVGYLLQRTRFVDDHLHRAVADGITQLVILGAGYDSRAHRFRELLQTVRVFEVDTPATQSWKRRRVERVLGTSPPNLTYVTANLEGTALLESLLSAGYERHRATVFVWEGVAMYLTQWAIQSTLSFVAAQSGRHSTIVFDYWTWPAGFDASPPQPSLLDVRLQNWREPIGFRPTPQDVESLISRTGMTVTEHLALFGSDARKRYLTRSDGTLIDTDHGTATEHANRQGRQTPLSWLAVATAHNRDSASTGARTRS